MQFARGQFSKMMLASRVGVRMDNAPTAFTQPAIEILNELLKIYVRSSRAGSAAVSFSKNDLS